MRRQGKMDEAVDIPGINREINVDCASRRGCWDLHARHAIGLAGGKMAMDPSAELVMAAPLARPPRRRFVAHHKWDRNFFLAFITLSWVGVLMGFYPAVT